MPEERILTVAYYIGEDEILGSTATSDKGRLCSLIGARIVEVWGQRRPEHEILY